MKSDHYVKQRQLKIYALVAEPGHRAYIGKTAGARLSAAYSAHICGDNAATRGHFEKQGPNRPELHLLETLEASNAEGYRHVLAWVHRFREAGYEILNHGAMREQAEQLQPHTQEILRELPEERIPRILAATRLERITDADQVEKIQVEPTEKEESEQPDTQLSIRLSRADKAQFCRYAGEMHMNQREAFCHLLAEGTRQVPGSEEWIRSKHIQSVLEDSQEKIQKLEAENEELKALLQAGASSRKEETIRARLGWIRKGIAGFYQTVRLTESLEEPLRKQRYKLYKARGGRLYPYPEEEGFFLFWPRQILWGSGRQRVYFVQGIDGEGEPRRLRFYPKPDFVGFAMDDPRYGRENSLWYVGCRRASDGAMDLMLALPVTGEIAPGRKTDEPQRKPTLMDQIRDAQSKR